MVSAWKNSLFTLPVRSFIQTFIELLLGLGSLPSAQDSLGLQVGQVSAAPGKDDAATRAEGRGFYQEDLYMHIDPSSLKTPLSVIISPLLYTLEQLDRISYPHKMSYISSPAINSIQRDLTAFYSPKALAEVFEPSKHSTEAY